MPKPTEFTDEAIARWAEEQIRLLADAVHSAKEMISITDESNRFTFVNQAFLDAYGYDESEILGRTPDFLYSARNPPGLCQQVFEETLLGSWTGAFLFWRRRRTRAGSTGDAVSGNADAARTGDAPL